LKRFRISKRELQKLLHIAYHGLQKSIFWSLPSEMKISLLDDEMSGVSGIAKHYPKLEAIQKRRFRRMEDDMISHQIPVYDRLIQDTIAIQNNNRHSHWLLPPFFPTNGCTNQVTQNHRQNGNLSLAHLLEGSRQNENGSCRSCSKERNATTRKDAILLMESSIYEEARCRLEKDNSAATHNFQLDLMATGTGYEVKKIAMSTEMRVCVLNFAKQIKLYSYEKLEKNITCEPLANTTVTLQIKEGSRKGGTLSHLENHGYIPLISARNRNQKKEFTRPNMLEVLIGTIETVERSCNPLRYESVQSLLKVYKEGEVPYNSEIWPLHYIGAKLKTLDMVNEQMMGRNQKDRLRHQMFKVNPDIEDDRFEFRVSKVNFWM
jgi:hypothetical protein